MPSTTTPPPATDPSPEALANAKHFVTGPGAREELARMFDAFRREGVEKEREKIAIRVGERCVLRLQIGQDPLAQVNEVIQDLANDIATDWADYNED